MQLIFHCYFRQSENICSKEELDKEVESWNETLNEHYGQIQTFVPKANHLEGNWSNFVQPTKSLEVWDTGVDTQLLKYIGTKSVEYPSSLVK